MRKRKRTLYPFHGERLTIFEISRRLGKVRKNGRPNDVFRRRVKRLGYEKALELTESGRIANADYVAFGTAVKTIKGWCEVFGMSDTTVFDRLSRGWEVHAALAVPPSVKHAKRDDSLSAIARRHGLKMPTVWARRKNGWSDANSLKAIDHAEIAKARSDGWKVRRDRTAINSQLLSLGIVVE